MRPSLRMTLLAVAVIGLDLALIRGACQADESEPCTSSLTFPALIFVLPLSLLAVAGVSTGLGVARRGYASPFATGYLLLGGLASLGVCLDFAAGTHQLPRLLNLVKGVLDPSLAPGVPEARLTSPTQSILDGWAGDLLFVAICALPQFFLAMIGGGLASRYGLVIVLRNRETPLGPQGAVSSEVLLVPKPSGVSCDQGGKSRQ
jgi:hypothetical protein